VKVYYVRIKSKRICYCYIYDSKFIYSASFQPLCKLQKYIKNLREQGIECKSIGIGKIFAQELKKYFRGELNSFTSTKRVYLDTFPNLNKNIYLYLMENVKAGQTVSYKEIAERFGLHPRHIGVIMKANKLPLLIPCHRVIQTNGKLGGYLGKTSLKKYLLKLEGRKFFK
jgi:O-6-methylguanine DNA methyltransferase